MMYDIYLQDFIKKSGVPAYALYGGDVAQMKRIIKQYNHKLDKTVFLLPFIKYSEKRLKNGKRSNLKESKENLIFPSIHTITRLARGKIKIYGLHNKNRQIALFFENKEQWSSFLTAFLRHILLYNSGEFLLHLIFYDSISRCMRYMDETMEILQKKYELLSPGSSKEQIKFLMDDIKKCETCGEIDFYDIGGVSVEKTKVEITELLQKCISCGMLRKIIYKTYKT